MEYFETGELDALTTYTGNGTVAEIAEGIEEIERYAFLNQDRVKTIVIPEGVTVIRSFAFSGCGSLECIELPDSLEKIEPYAFDDCPSLSYFSLSPKNGYYNTFNGALYTKDMKKMLLCPRRRPGVTSFTVPETVTDIWPDAFVGCCELREIVLPDGLKHLGWGAFTDCSALERIRIPDGVKLLLPDTFRNCDALREVTLPASLREIGTKAFSGCRSLKRIDIPEGTELIETNAFSRCMALNEVSIPESMSFFGMGAFEDCPSLEEIRFPNGRAEIGSFALKGCKALKSVHLSDGMTGIPAGMFDGCTALEHITIPGSVLSIGRHAFERCESLREIVIPEGVTVIESHAFSDCKALRSIVLPRSVRDIESYAFKGCIRLHDCPAGGLVELGAGAFAESGLERFTVPAPLNGIAPSTFEGCLCLKAFEIDPANPYYTVIDGALYADSGKELVLCPPGCREITLPAETERVNCSLRLNTLLENIDVDKGNPFFRSIDGFLCGKDSKELVCYPHRRKDIRVPEGVERIGPDVFDDETYDRTLYLPKTLVSIDTEHNTLNAMNAVHVADGNPCFTLVHDILYSDGGTRLVSYARSNADVHVPEGVTHIEPNAFRYCMRLRELTLPDTLISIGRTAFYCCERLRTITIPESVRFMGKEAFSGPCEWILQRLELRCSGFEFEAPVFTDRTILKLVCRGDYNPAMFDCGIREIVILGEGVTEED